MTFIILPKITSQLWKFDILVPFFTKRTDPQKERDLSVKLIKAKEKSNFQIESTNIYLNQSAAIRLRDELNELFALKSTSDNGNFLIIKLGEGSNVDLSGLDSKAVAQAVISILETEEVSANIDAVNFSDDLAFAFRHSIQIKSLIKAMDELENALSTNDNEQFYQDWCETNS